MKTAFIDTKCRYYKMQINVCINPNLRCHYQNLYSHLGFLLRFGNFDIGICYSRMQFCICTIHESTSLIYKGKNRLIFTINIYSQ